MSNLLQRTALKAFATAGAVCALSAGVATADVKYTQETRMPGMGGATPTAAGNAPMSVSTTWIKQGAQRVETRQNSGTAQTHEVSLTLCEKRQIIRMEPALKIYTVTPLDASGMPITKASTPTTAKPATEKPTTGKVTITYSVKSLGVETVAGFKARHYMLTTQMQSSGCAGDSNHTSKMEIWVTDYQMPDFSCGSKPFDYGQYLGDRNNCKVTVEQKGDVAAYQNAYKGLIVRMKMYHEDKVFMVQETTMVSSAKLDDTMFTVPAGFKQVSEEEFNNARTQAMVAAMQAKSAAGNSSTTKTPPADDDMEPDATVPAADDDDSGGQDSASDDDDNAAEQAAKDAAAAVVTRKKKPRFRLPF